MAINLYPTLYEAIDNRAFCKMDLGRWREAIEDFNLSLTIHPYSALAEFSIGECYLKLDDHTAAKEYFNRALALEPDHELSKEFLQKISEPTKAL
jgi:tetratricopeptide (TPR) repeat protein